MLALACYAASQVNRFYYFPMPGQDFVTDCDFVVSVEPDGEHVIVWHCGETRVHVSQFDEPVQRRNDPDRSDIAWARAEAATGNPSIMPRHIS